MSNESTDIFIQRTVTPIRRNPWAEGETAAFLERVYDARWMIKRGHSLAAVREKHGAVVLRAAREKAL